MELTGLSGLLVITAVRQIFRDVHGAYRPCEIGIAFQRMSGDIQTCHLLFHPQQLLERKLLSGRKLEAAHAAVLVGKAEQVGLAIGVAAALCVYRPGKPLPAVKHLRAVGAQSVQRAAFDERLGGAAVQLLAVHPFAQVGQADKISVFALLQQVADEAASEIAHGEQSEANAVALGGEAGIAAVDVRRKHLDAVLSAFRNIFRGLCAAVQHARQQRRHVFPEVVRLEIGGLVGDDGVGRGVGFVEGVVGEGAHLVEYLVRDPLRHAVAHRSRNGDTSVPVRRAVDEHLAFLLHYVVLFLRHRTAHKVGAAI